MPWHVSPSVFESVLNPTFEDYIQYHLQPFRYFQLRTVVMSTSSRSIPPAYSCSKCSELVCTSRHSQHGDYKGSEYKDIASCGYEELAKFKTSKSVLNVGGRWRRQGDAVTILAWAARCKSAECVWRSSIRAGLAINI